MIIICKTCNLEFKISRKSKTGICKKCQRKAQRERAKKEISCKGCEVKFKTTGKNRLGLCQECREPEFECKDCGVKFRSPRHQNQLGLCQPCRNKDTCKRSTKKHKEKRLEARTRWRKDNQDKIEEYRKNNKEKEEERSKKWYEKNKKKKLAQDKERRKDNPEKYKQMRQTRKYKAEARASANERRAARLNQTPKWANLDQIKEFYLNCPNGYQVDHIIPLRGESVGGFHVLSNLQYLKEEINQSKNNRILECYLTTYPCCVLNIEDYL